MPKETLIGLEDQLAQAQRELDELRAQRNATDAVLQVINRSTFDLQNVFDTLVESAARLCEADSAHIYRRQSADYRLAAACGFSGEYREYISRIGLAPSRNTLVGRTALERQVVTSRTLSKTRNILGGKPSGLGVFAPCSACRYCVMAIQSA